MVCVPIDVALLGPWCGASGVSTLPAANAHGRVHVQRQDSESHTDLDSEVSVTSDLPVSATPSDALSGLGRGSGIPRARPAGPCSSLPGAVARRSCESYASLRKVPSAWSVGALHQSHPCARRQHDQYLGPCKLRFFLKSTSSAVPLWSL